MEKEQLKAWRKQVFEVQTWRQVRGLAGAVMCETRDLCNQWPQWHTLLFEEQVPVDMRVVGPQDMKKMLLEQARMRHWKEWGAKHEYEELRKECGSAINTANNGTIAGVLALVRTRWFSKPLSVCSDEAGVRCPNP